MEVESVGFEAGKAFVRFGDRDELSVTPLMKRDRVVGIGCLKWLMDGVVRVSVSSEGIDGRDIEGLRVRLYSAIDYERRIYREYRAKRIAEEEWAERYRPFWRVSIKMRPVLEVVRGWSAG